MRAKKSLGQYFLRSEKALATIVRSAELTSTDTVLEIGPGEGVLTERLLKKTGKVIAVEKDDNLFETLQEKFSEEIRAGRLELVHGDILQFNPNGKYKLVANIPYNITGEIFRKFLSDDFQPSLMVLLIQKEVAERIVARDGKESILSISVKAYGKPEYVETVKAGSFVPAPKVDSAILRIDSISKTFFTLVDTGCQQDGGRTGEGEFFRMVKNGFKSKRKKLSSNLATIYPRELVEKAFIDLKLDQNTRAEDLSLETWKKISEVILKNP